jgi:hypothetical protein
MVILLKAPLPPNDSRHNRHANAASLFDWTSELITLLFDQVEDQWKLRNEALHGRDDAEHALFRRARLCEKATRLYAHAGTLLARRECHPCTD